MIIAEPIKDDGAGSNPGPREAFCPLLFAAGKGAIMVITDDEGNYLGEQYVRGLCTEVHDCDECEYMQHEISQHPAEMVCWVCPTCLDAVYKKAKQNNIHIHVPGFYSQGQCEYPWCERPETGSLKMPERYSRFRQVVFGRIRT